MKNPEVSEGKQTFYKAMYYHLFNAVTDALRALDAGHSEDAKRLLIRAQQACEEMYLDA